MRKAVRLAHEARTRFLRETPSNAGRNIKIVLSLGSFGATLNPTQEFDGFYPPPYGPKAYDPSQPKHVQPTSFISIEEDLRAVKALTQFHVERLRIFAGDDETWSLIDGIAFETIPLRREIRSVRRAVRLLHQNELRVRKAWWVSTLFPDGTSPDKRVKGEHVTVADIVQAMMDGDEPKPDAVGINCTSAAYLTSLLKDMTQEIQNRSSVPRPSLVIYPNGGDEWNPKTKSWQAIAEGDAKAQLWASQLESILFEMQRAEVWPEIAIGGCCRTGPAEIAAFVARLKQV